MDYQDELVFLTINRKLDLAGVEIKEGQDLPLIKSSMVQNLKDKNWQESIPFIDFLLGMVLCQTVDPALAQSQGYDKILQKSPYQGQVISRIMTGDFDRQAKMDFLTSLEKLHIKEEDITYLKTTLKEEEIRQGKKEGQDLERNLIPIIKSYGKISEESPFFGQALLRLSGIYAGLGHYIKARHYAREALLKEMPEEVKNQARLAIEELEDYANMEAVESYLNLQDLEKAKKHLNKVSQQYPNPDHVHYFLASIALAENDLEASKSHYQEALKLADQGLYHERLAFVNSQLGLIQEAIDHYEKALEKGSNPYTIHHNLAYLYLERKPEEALYHAKSAYNLNNSQELEDLIKTLEKDEKDLDREDEFK